MTTKSRRKFVKGCLSTAASLSAYLALGRFLSACGVDPALENGASLNEQKDDEEFVTLYDTYAMATYFDGGIGPQTGVIKVDDIVARAEKGFVYWHGHGGVNHRFTMKPEHFDRLRNLERVELYTTTVDNHSHKLFIDPRDTRYRVPGAQPVRVSRRVNG